MVAEPPNKGETDQKCNPGIVEGIEGIRTYIRLLQDCGVPF